MLVSMLSLSSNHLYSKMSSFSYYTFLATLMLIPCLGIELHQGVLEIVPSVNSVSPCSLPCLTLSDFATRPSHLDTVENITLILEVENHTLISQMSVINITSFFMLSRTKSAWITCNQSASFNFINVSVVEIVNITFFGCGNIYPVNTAVLEFHHLGNAVISECNLLSSKGKVILAHQSTVKISSTVVMNTSCSDGVTSFEESATFIEESLFINNKAINFGVIYAYKNSTLNIVQTNFENNTVERIGIVQVQINSHAMLSNVTILGNRCYFGALHSFESSVESYGKLMISGNAAILNTVYLVQSKVTFTGELLYSDNHGTILITNSDVTFSGSSLFSNSKAKKRGGALTGIQSRIHFSGMVSFYNNSANVGGAISMYESKLLMNGEVRVVNNTAHRTGGGAYLYQSELVCQDLCVFSENKGQKAGGGIHAFDSLVIVGSKIWKTSRSRKNISLTLTDNEAMMGGGLCLETYSRLYGIGEDGYFYKVEFRRNNAKCGGAIYVDDHSNPDICASNLDHYLTSTECFLQTLFYTPATGVEFIDNRAEVNGSVLFGGLLDRCTVSRFSYIYEDKYLRTDTKSSSESITPVVGLDYFQNVTGTTDIEAISSHAVRICYCLNDKPNCSIGQNHSVNVMKGEAFNVTLVAVNQVSKAVEALVLSKTLSTEGYLNSMQYKRKISNTCTNLTFNVYSSNFSDSLVIYADGPCRDMGISRSTVEVVFNDCVCPVGFERSERNQKFDCDCKCHHEIQNFVTKCNLTTQSFLRDHNFWIKHTNHNGHPGYLTYPNCPFDYCHPSQPGKWINLNTLNGADDQCAPHRTGLLCGACKPGYSLAAGSSHCITCHNWYIPIAALSVIVAGIALVVLILVLNLTVAVGTINGLIFYANVVATNSSVFLPFSKPNVFTVFIAWLNLSVGFDTCFFKGTDAYIKAWLLFIFPIYVISLVVIVILLSRCSSRFAQLIGKRNPVATLATLIILSYTNLLQMVIKILSFAILKYPDGSQEVVWLPDASVKYCRGKHFPLFLLAIFIIAIGLAYTFILFTWQWLLQVPRTRVTNWISSAKLNFFIYMYHVPYTAKHRYWTGLLLLTRIVLYLIIDVLDDPQIHLLAVGLSTTCLLLLKALLEGRVYRKKLIDCLDTMNILNILALSLISFYSLGNQQNQNLVAYVSLGTAFVIFLFVILYHLNLTLMEIRDKMNHIIQKRSQCKLNNSYGIFGTANDTEMNPNINITSSEVTMSPMHSETCDHLSGESSTQDKQPDDTSHSLGMTLCEESNDLREPLLL